MNAHSQVSNFDNLQLGFSETRNFLVRVNFSHWFGTKWISVWYEVNKKKINTSPIKFDITRTIQVNLSLLILIVTFLSSRTFNFVFLKRDIFWWGSLMLMMDGWTIFSCKKTNQSLSPFMIFFNLWDLFSHYFCYFKDFYSSV